MPSAVLMIFFNKKNQTHLVYIRRTKGMNLHSGQMAFPGGKIDPEDESSYATAVRETFEEIGVDAHLCTYLGKMGFFETLTSGYDAAVHLVWCPEPQKYKINQNEVAEVVEIPVATLLEQFQPDLDFDNPQEIMYLNFRYQLKTTSEVVILWGLTARITHHFMQGLSEFFRIFKRNSR
ncbi:MAG: NUDIX hydrolase [bacterium]